MSEATLHLKGLFLPGSPLSGSLACLTSSDLLGPVPPASSALALLSRLTQASGMVMWSGPVTWATTGTLGHPRCVMVPVARQQASAQALCPRGQLPTSWPAISGLWGCQCPPRFPSSLETGREEGAGCALGTP